MNEAHFLRLYFFFFFRIIRQEHFQIKELLDYVQRQELSSFYDCSEVWQYCRRVAAFPPEEIAWKNYVETSRLQHQVMSTLPSTQSAAPSVSATSKTLRGKQTATIGAGGKKKKVSSDKKQEAGDISSSFSMMAPEKFQFYVHLIGDYLIAMKRLFDAKAQSTALASMSLTAVGSSGSISRTGEQQRLVRPEIISGLLLDLGIHHEGFLRGRAAVQDLVLLQPSSSSASSSALDEMMSQIGFTFHQFLQIYFVSSNLTALVDFFPQSSLSSASATKKATKGRQEGIPPKELPKVVPNVFTGLWEVVSQSVVFYSVLI